MVRYAETVKNLAYRMTLCDAASDDVTQEVFLKVMRHADSFHGKAKFSTWLYRIAINTSKEHLRRRTNAPLGENHREVPDHDYQRPDQAVMHREMYEEVEQALLLLSPKLRAAIVLTSIEKLPASEAASIEGCSTATMHWRVHQARKQLKRTLQRYLDS